MNSGWLTAWLGSLLGIFSLQWAGHPSFWILALFCVLWVELKRTLLLAAGAGAFLFLIHFEFTLSGALRPALLKNQIIDVCAVEPTRFGSIVKIKSAEDVRLLNRKFYFSKKLKEGVCFKTEGSFRALGSSEVPGFPPRELRREIKGPVGALRSKSVPEEALEQTSRTMSLGKAFERALVFGEGKYLPSEIWESSKRLGLIHLFVVSGLHIGWIFLSIGFFFRYILTPLRSFSPWLSSLGVFSYVFGFGLGIPAIRAAGIFFLASVASKLLPPVRRFSSKEKCAMLGLGFCLLEPLSVPTSTYILSFGVCFSLLVAKENLTRGFLATASACFLGGLLYMPIYPIAFLANLLFIPCFGFIVFPVVVIAVWLPFFEPLRDQLCGYFADSLLILSQVKGIDFPIEISLNQALLLFVFSLILVFYSALNLRKLILFVGISFLCCGFLPDFVGHWRSTVEVLDVGQGDGLILRLRQKVILVDGGRHPFLGAQLRQRGIKQIDLWVLSHFDADHSENFKRLSRDFQVKEVWVSRWDQSALSRWIQKYYGQRARRATEESLSLQSFSFDLRAHVIERGAAARPVKNRDSLVLELWKGEELKGAFLGDLPAAQERKWLRRRHKRTRVAPDFFLKIAHHGSPTSTSKEILEFFRPKLAIISVGRGNSYRFPHSSVLDRLEIEGATIRRTDTLGSLKINLDF